MSTSLYFVDKGIQNYQSLLTGLEPNAEVYLMDGLVRGLDQMLASLLGRTGIDALHVFSHGGVGALYLGSTILTADNLPDYRDELATLGAALKENGDIFLYGCNVAQGSHGQQFISQLAQLTGADVSASTDSTGNAADGGNWMLEAASGYIDEQPLSLPSYEGVLGGNTAPTFVVGGKVITVFDAYSRSAAYSVAIQADGKILAAGITGSATGLVRYNTDGSLDTSFSDDGKATVVVSGNGGGQSIAVQSDGRILVVGDGFSLARFNSDGSLDIGFDGDGKVVTNITNQYAVGDFAQSVVIQPDGKIIIAGSIYLFNADPKNKFALVRYNTDGSLDRSFDGDGKVTTDVGSGMDRGESVALQADGKILVAGTTGSGSPFDFTLLRYNPNGSLDTTFDGDGKVITSIGAGFDWGCDVAIQSDGKIVVAGYSSNGSNNDFALVRYDSDGSLDTSFSDDGKAVTDIDSGNDYGRSVTIQADGKILVAGYSTHTMSGGFNTSFALVRYNPDGSLDTSFDGDGKVFNSLGWADVGFSVTVQSDGKILVAGSTEYNDSFSLVRYNSDGSIDGTFGSYKVNTLNGTPHYIENGAPVVLDSDVRVVDAELANANNYAGSILTLSRHGGANVQDIFSATGTLGALIQGGDLSVDGIFLGTIVNNCGGTLQLSFDNATQGQVDAVMQQIAYCNNSNTPPASVQIDWQFSDGNTGAQGSGGVMDTNGSTTVLIAAVRDDLTLTGTSNNDALIGDLIDVGSYDQLSGLAGDDFIDGKSGNDILCGGAGIDTLNGGAGNDTADYSEKAAGVWVTLNKSINAPVTVGGITEDRIRNIENLIGGTGRDKLAGDSIANILDGNDGNDTLSGGMGADVLIGGAGSDRLTGGWGADRFVFDAALGPRNVDIVTDFHSGIDKIVLDDDIFTAFDVMGTNYWGGLNAGAFYAAAGATTVQAVTDRLIYDTTSGKLYYDSDGSAATAASQIALIGTTTHPALVESDFIVIA